MYEHCSWQTKCIVCSTIEADLLMIVALAHIKILYLPRSIDSSMPVGKWDNLGYVFRAPRLMQ